MEVCLSPDKENKIQNNLQRRNIFIDNIYQDQDTSTSKKHGYTYMQH